MRSSTSHDDAPDRQFHDWPGRLFDFVAVIGLLFVGGLILLASTHVISRLSNSRIPAFVVVLVALGALLLRRAHPVVTWGVIVGAVLVESVVGSVSLVHPLLLVATYTVAARLRWRISLALTVVAVVLFAAVTSLGSGESGLTVGIADVVAAAAAYTVGLYAGTRMDYIRALHDRTFHLSRERDLVAEQAVSQERVRIARELHDIAAHNLSLVIVQATALQTQISIDSPARPTAENIVEASRRAMDDMRRMLGVLRLGANDRPDHAPQPGIGDIPALIEEIRSAGVDVQMDVQGDPTNISPGVGLSAYRIVQEALTNVLRHAAASHCRVGLQYGSVGVEIRVTDDGTGGSLDMNDAQGHGLLGMRERVTAFGGEFFAGPVPSGGFAVRAVIPVRAAR